MRKALCPGGRVSFGKRLLAAGLAVAALTAGSMFTTFATEDPVSVTYTFSGVRAEKPGYACGKITVTPEADAAAEGYYLVYYTDEKGVLAGYDELATVPITGGKVSIPVPDGLMIPLGATGIAVFESDKRFLDEPPAIDTAIGVCEIPESKRLKSLGDLQVSFGALSDTHMNYQPYDRGAFEKLAYSLDFFAEKKMDYLVITGDATGDRGENPDLEAQYEKHLEILNASSFPADKVYEGIGNHGNTPKDAPLLDQYLGGEDEDHPYEGSPYFSLFKEGKEGQRDLLFIFTGYELKAPSDSAKYETFSVEQMDWIESLLTEYGETETNIFMIIHAPFLNFGAGDRKNGGYGACIPFKAEYPQTMRLKGLLETYKDVVVMSGHTHVTLYDGVNYSTEGEKFARTVHIGSNCQPCGYGGTDTYARSTDGRYTVTPEYGSEGYTVEIYGKYIVFTGYNFSTGKKIPAACLLMPVSKAAEEEEEVSLPEESSEPATESSETASLPAPAEEKGSFPIGWVAGGAAAAAGVAVGVTVALKKKKK